jgi:NarL family two-component system sensor histidine kinase YdfH
MTGGSDSVRSYNGAKNEGAYNLTIMEHPQSSIPLWTRLKAELRYCFGNMNAVWPFFFLLTGAILVMYVLTLVDYPAVRQPGMLLLFTLMMLVHVALHWTSPVIAHHSGISIAYLLVQVGLAVGMIVLTHSQVLVIGLFMGLIGEALGVVRPLRRSLVAIFFLITAAFLQQGLIFGWSGIWIFGVTALPLTFFVIVYVYLFTRQLEERERAEALLKELETAHRQLTEYATRIEELTLTNERQRMARELHDTLSQGLAGIILQLEAAEQHLGVGHTEKAASIVTQAKTRARSTLAEARQVIDDLRSVYPTSANLQDFIRAEAEHFTSLTGLPCDVTLEVQSALSDQLALQVEKIISEGLTNIVRHAHARRSWITLASTGNTLTLEIGDDGQGFAAAEPFASGHYGLVGIRERVRLAGGTLTIDSHAGQGTVLRIAIPMSDSEMQA